MKLRRTRIAVYLFAAFGMGAAFVSHLRGADDWAQNVVVGCALIAATLDMLASALRTWTERKP